MIHGAYHAVPGRNRLEPGVSAVTFDHCVLGLSQCLWRQLLTKVVFSKCTDHMFCWSKGAKNHKNLVATSSLCELAL